MFALRERRVHVTQEDFEMAVAKVMKKDTEKNMSLRKLWKWGLCLDAPTFDAITEARAIIFRSFTTFAKAVEWCNGMLWTFASLPCALSYAVHAYV